MNSTRRLILSAAALMLLIPSVSAKNGNPEKRYDWKGTHELTFSVGGPATVYIHDFMFLYNFNLHNTADFKRTYIPSLMLDYGWNVEKWLSIGAGVYYNWARDNIYDKASGASLEYKDCNSLAVLFNIRVYWLNRQNFRMYSSIGLGAGLYTHSGDRPQWIFDCDLRVFGVTVGKKLYGRFEAGVMMHGLVTAGIGYRF